MTSKPKRLTNLKIREVSSVDRGAGEGVKVALMKRDGKAVAATISATEVPKLEHQATVGAGGDHGHAVPAGAAVSCLSKVEQQDKGGDRRSPGAPPPGGRKAVADDAGLTEHQRKTMLRVASVPKAEALASYARQAEDDTLRKLADRIQARAVRRGGQIQKTFKNEQECSREW